MSFEPVPHVRLLAISRSTEGLTRVTQHENEAVNMARELMLARTRIMLLEMDVESLQKKVTHGHRS